MVNVVDHYFTSSPLDPDSLADLDLTLAGRAVTVKVAPGVFSSTRLDLGTSVLLRNEARQGPELPESGDLLDLGCGWGPIALSMAMLAPEATVWATDVNESARELTRINAQRLGLANVRVCLPEEVEAPGFGAIWSNPPIRIGKTELHRLLRAWLTRLTADGHADLVVQRNLGADSLARWIKQDLGMSCAKKASAKGFRVLRVTAA